MDNNEVRLRLVEALLPTLSKFGMNDDDTFVAKLDLLQRFVENTGNPASVPTYVLKKTDRKIKK